jgi:hypothetical protein
MQLIDARFHGTWGSCTRSFMYNAGEFAHLVSTGAGSRTSRRCGFHRSVLPASPHIKNMGVSAEQEIAFDGVYPILRFHTIHKSKAE